MSNSNDDDEGDEVDGEEEEVDLAALTKLYQPDDRFGIMAWHNFDAVLLTNPSNTRSRWGNKKSITTWAHPILQTCFD